METTLEIITTTYIIIILYDLTAKKSKDKMRYQR